MPEGLKYNPENLGDYDDVQKVAEVQEQEKKDSGYYLKYIGGAVHVHSNESEYGVFASQSLPELVNYLKNEVDKESGRAEFMLLSEHSKHLGLEKNGEWLESHGFDPGEIAKIKKGGNLGAQIISLSPESKDVLQRLEAAVLEEEREATEKVSEEKNLRVFLGVETSIMGPNGELTLPNNTLEKLDVVIASIHDDVIRTSEGNIPVYEKTPQGLIDLYSKVLDNPNVDVLGHPIKNNMTEIIRQLQTELESTGTLESLAPLFKKMAEKNVAFEINMKDPLIGLPEGTKGKSLFGEIIRMAKDYGTPLSVGIDWHLFEHWQNTDDIISKVDETDRALLENEIENPESVKAAEDIRKRYGVGIKFWLRLVRVCKMLENSGIEKDQVVNSSKASFENWLSKRKSVS